MYQQQVLHPLTHCVCLSLESDTNTSVFSTACPLCFPHNEAGLKINNLFPFGRLLFYAYLTEPL